MSAPPLTKIGDFYRGDSLHIQVVSKLNGLPEDLRGKTIEVVLRAPGGTQALVVMKSYLVPDNSSTAELGEETIALLPADSANVEPGEYIAYLVKTLGTTERVTIHEESLRVRKGVV